MRSTALKLGLCVGLSAWLVWFGIHNARALPFAAGVLLLGYSLELVFQLRASARRLRELHVMVLRNVQRGVPPR